MLECKGLNYEPKNSKGVLIVFECVYVKVSAHICMYILMYVCVRVCSDCTYVWSTRIFDKCTCASQTPFCFQRHIMSSWQEKRGFGDTCACIRTNACARVRRHARLRVRRRTLPLIYCHNFPINLFTRSLHTGTISRWYVSSIFMCLLRGTPSLRQRLSSCKPWRGNTTVIHGLGTCILSPRVHAFVGQIRELLHRKTQQRGVGKVVSPIRRYT
jgi:hypothetical protein